MITASQPSKLWWPRGRAVGQRLQRESAARGPPPPSWHGAQAGARRGAAEGKGSRGGDGREREGGETEASERKKTRKKPRRSGAEGRKGCPEQGEGRK